MDRADGKLMSVVKGRKPSFAVFLTWPDIKNAEYEVVHRIAAAGKNIGARVTIVDNDGYPLWATDREIGPDPQRISVRDHDFAISLHFESPRLLDLFTYIALWNPPEFYKVFGYEASMRKFITHNDVLSCESDAADQHAVVAFEGSGRKLQLPMPTLFHSVPEPFLKPSIDAGARLFYIGMNWERLSGEKGRHHDLLEALDAEDLINIYGPEMFLGVRPWEGFKNYVGEIAFDGRSILPEINKAGICLAFSSAAHQRSGIMSNRLFEGLAAGAAIIANPHAIIDKYFSDCVYVVDDQKSSKELSQDILRIVRSIRRDPKEALGKARRGQELLKTKFSLESSLKSLIGSHPNRSAIQRGVEGATRPDVAVIVTYSGFDAEELGALLDDIVAQRGVNVHLTLVCDSGFYDVRRAKIKKTVRSVASFRVITGDLYARSPGNRAPITRRMAEGPLVAEALAGVTAPMFCLVSPGAHWFSDHLNSLAGALERSDACLVAASGLIVETASEGTGRRHLDSLVFDPFSHALWAVSVGESSRFLFRTALLPLMPQHLINILDGLEHRALLLWAFLKGPVAQSSYATLVRKTVLLVEGMSPFIEEDLQVGLIRDSVRANPDWLRLTMGTPPPPAPIVLSTGLPGETYITKAGEHGTKFLIAGFSTPEKNGTWIDGDVGTIKFLLPALKEPVVLSVFAGSRRSAAGQPQRCTMAVNDRIAIRERVLNEGEQEMRILLEPNQFDEPVNDVVVEIRAAHAEQVKNDKGRVIDARHLSIWVSKVGLSAAQAAGFASLTPGETYATTAGDPGANLLVAGFSTPDENWTWIDGESGTIKFSLPPLVEPAILTLFVGSRRSAAGQDQRCTVLVNDRIALRERVLTEGGQELQIPLEPNHFDKAVNDVVLEIRTAHAEQVTDEIGRVVDARHLGIWVSKVGLAAGRAVDLVSLVPGDTYETKAGGAGAKFLVAGFSSSEKNWTWIDGKAGRLEFSLPRLDEQVILSICVGSRRSKTGQRQRCTVTLNERIAIHERVLNEDEQELQILLEPNHFDKAVNDVVIEIWTAHAEQVEDENGGVVDARHLGIWVSQIGIATARTADLPSLARGVTYTTTAGDYGTNILVTGFSIPEKNWTWIDGQVGTIKFHVPPLYKQAMLTLLVGSRRSAAGQQQRCTVAVNEYIAIQELVLTEDEQELKIPLEPNHFDKDVNDVEVEIRAAHAEQVRNEDGAVVDARSLGIWVSKIGLAATK